MKKFRYVKVVISCLLAMMLVWPLSISAVYAEEAGEETEEESKSGKKESSPIIIGEEAEDTLPLEKTTELDDLIEITPHAARVVDKITPQAVAEDDGRYGYESGDKNEFVVIDLDICNISMDEVDLDEIIAANLVYNGSYTFTPYKRFETEEDKDPDLEFNESLYGTWEGLWFANNFGGWAKTTLEFTDTDIDGNLVGTLEYEQCDPFGDGHVINENYVGSYSVYAVRDSLGIDVLAKDWINKPSYNFDAKPFWLWPVAPNVLCGATYYNNNNWDASDFQGIISFTRTAPALDPTVIDVLQETTYSLVFNCPNRVVKSLDDCQLVISVGDEVYEIPLD